jgi:hypothetical protein
MVQPCTCLSSYLPWALYAGTPHGGLYSPPPPTLCSGASRDERTVSAATNGNRQNDVRPPSLLLLLLPPSHPSPVTTRRTRFFVGVECTTRVQMGRSSHVHTSFEVYRHQNPLCRSLFSLSLSLSLSNLPKPAATTTLSPRRPEVQRQIAEAAKTQGVLDAIAVLTKRRASGGGGVSGGGSGGDSGGGGSPPFIRGCQINPGRAELEALKRAVGWTLGGYNTRPSTADRQQKHQDRLAVLMEYALMPSCPSSCLHTHTRTPSLSHPHTHPPPPPPLTHLFT